MAEIEILPSNSTKKPLQVRAEWMQNPKEVPWVQFGNVFLSLFETGENSWPPIVKHLTSGQQAPKLFTILTGRHGSNMKSTTADGQFTQIKGPDHLTQDLQKVADLKKQLPNGTDLMLLDVTDTDFNSMRRLRSIVRQLVQANRYAILAWCFSIYAFKTVPVDTEMDEIMKRHPNLVDKTIKQIIAEDWTPL